MKEIIWRHIPSTAMTVCLIGGFWVLKAIDVSSSWWAVCFWVLCWMCFTIGVFNDTFET